MTAAASADRIPAIVCVDVEPDPRDVDRTRREPWRGFEALQSVFSRWRPALTARTGAPARFAWFVRMDEQIADVYGSPAWGISTYRRFIDEARALGDEFCVHPHTYRWEPTRGGWISERADQRWIERCVRTSMGTFHEAFGEPSVSSRFGDHWMNDATVRLLEELGVRYDLTLEPGKPLNAGLIRGEPSTGNLPDLTMVPAHPYRPSRLDFRRPDPARADGLWMLPVTTRPLGAWLRRARRAYCRLTGLESPTDVTSLSVGLRPVLFRSVLDGALGAAHGPLVFVLRSDSGVDVRERVRVQANLEYLLTERVAARLAFVPPTEAARRLGLD